MHQSVADGVTVNVLFPKELITFYEAFSAGKPAAMANLPIQYADYAYWQRQWMQTEAFASQLAYWRAGLIAAPPPVPWPTAPSPPPSSTYPRAMRPCSMSYPMLEKISRLLLGGR